MTRDKTKRAIERLFGSYSSVDLRSHHEEIIRTAHEFVKLHLGFHDGLSLVDVVQDTMDRLANTRVPTPQPLEQDPDAFPDFIQRLNGLFLGPELSKAALSTLLACAVDLTIAQGMDPDAVRAANNRYLRAVPQTSISLLEIGTFLVEHEGEIAWQPVFRCGND